MRPVWTTGLNASLVEITRCRRAKKITEGTRSRKSLVTVMEDQGGEILTTFGSFAGHDIADFRYEVRRQHIFSLFFAAGTRTFTFPASASLRSNDEQESTFCMACSRIFAFIFSLCLFTSRPNAEGPPSWLRPYWHTPHAVGESFHHLQWARARQEKGLVGMLNPERRRSVSIYL